MCLITDTKGFIDTRFSRLETFCGGCIKDCRVKYRHDSINGIRNVSVFCSLLRADKVCKRTLALPKTCLLPPQIWTKWKHVYFENFGTAFSETNKILFLVKKSVYQYVGKCFKVLNLQQLWNHDTKSLQFIALFFLSCTSLKLIILFR